MKNYIYIYLFIVSSHYGNMRKGKIWFNKMDNVNKDCIFKWVRGGIYELTEYNILWSLTERNFSVIKKQKLFLLITSVDCEVFEYYEDRELLRSGLCGSSNSTRFVSNCWESRGKRAARRLDKDKPKWWVLCVRGVAWHKHTLSQRSICTRGRGNSRHRKNATSWCRKFGVCVWVYWWEWVRVRTFSVGGEGGENSLGVCVRDVSRLCSISLCRKWLCILTG